MGRFAAETTVPVEKSRAEIETLLHRYGADAFGYATRDGMALIEFRCKERHVRFVLPLPSRGDRQFQRTPHKHQLRSPEAQHQAWEQACRQRWRALLLAIKAKLEAVDCGIAEFETEFLAYVVDPATRQTVGELVRPMIAERYLGNNMDLPLGLPAPQKD